MQQSIFYLLLISLILAASCKPSRSGYSVSKTASALRLQNAEQDVAVYNFQKICPPDSQPSYYCRGGFLHPLYSPLGAVLTDDFPVGHTHQHAIFTAWTKTKFKGEIIDFWNQHKEQGTVLFKQIDTIYNDTDHCGFRALHEHYSFIHKANILLETWELRMNTIENYNVMDILIQQKNITDDTLFIPTYHYGGIGFRGSKHWNVEDSIHFMESHRILAANGISGTAANHTRPGWVAIYGMLEQGIAGMAVFCHKTNFMHPQPVRVHNTMPYFSFTPVVDTSLFIAPASTYEMQYRVVAFDGNPDPLVLDSLYTAYNR